MAARATHMMIRVLDEARALAFYDLAFGLTVAERIEFETFTLIYLSNATQDFELELTVNKGRETPYDLGDGYGHFAVTVDDVDAEHARLEASGLGPRKLVDFRNGERALARFFFIRDPDGYEIEVMQRGGRYK